MTSKRMKKRLANRRPLWLERAEAAQRSAAAGAAAEYDKARVTIRRVPLAADRDAHWRALTVSLEAFNERFVGPADEAAPVEGRLAEPERAFKARIAAVDAAAAQYDLARKYLRRMQPAANQEVQWRELEAELRRFNQRFSRPAAGE